MCVCVCSLQIANVNVYCLVDELRLNSSLHFSVIIRRVVAGRAGLSWKLDIGTAVAICCVCCVVSTIWVPRESCQPVEQFNSRHHDPDDASHDQAI